MYSQDLEDDKAMSLLPDIVVQGSSEGQPHHRMWKFLANVLLKPARTREMPEMISLKTVEALQTRRPVCYIITLRILLGANMKVSVTYYSPGATILLISPSISPWRQYEPVKRFF
jgi:hypothetical protein